ncbi:MAG: NAD-binding protein [Candidatus Heimdallarchaeaceae archaeon]
MSFRRRLIKAKNQFLKFRFPFLIFLFFWVSGIIVLYFIEPNKSFLNLLLVSISVRESAVHSDFVGVYQLLWPTLFELLVLSFLLSALLEHYSYNPVERAKKLAQKQKNHTIVLGFNHLGERIVDYLKTHKHPFSLVEVQQDKVADLISLGDPIVIGDYTDIDVIQMAGVKKCKEVFCVTSNLRRALIAAENIRKLNPDCKLYMRMFNEHFRKYLEDEPYCAYVFSTSEWAMKSIREWCKNIDTTAIVLGNDTLVKRIIHHFNEQQKKLIVIDPEIEPEVYSDCSYVKVYQQEALYIENLEEICSLKEISQIYIAWNKEHLFSSAIILTIALKRSYPHLQVFVRMFDEELAKIVENIQATAFSTSAFAFKMLQKEVTEDSGIYKKEETIQG